MATISKAKKVEKYLRSQITCGVWAVGDRLPGHEEIGLRIGVSEITVKNALVRLAGEGLLKRRQRSGTCVAHTTLTSNIGILCPFEALSSKVGFYYQELLKAAKNMICGSGYRPILAVGHGRGREFIESITLLDSSIADNTVGAFSIDCPLEIQEALEKKGIHTVSIGLGAARPAVMLDYAKALEMAAKQFYDHGYDDYILMEMDPHPSDRSHVGYKERDRMICECPGFGAKRWVSIPWGGSDCDYVYEEFKRFWASGRRPKGIFFPDDGVCDIATRAIMELGIKVPEELGIITEAAVGKKFDFPVMLNRIEFNPSEFVAIAHEMLMSLINGQKPNQDVMLVAPRFRPGRSL